MLSRREVIAGGLGALGGAAALPALSAAGVLGTAQRDPDLLVRLIEIEQAIALGYDQVVSVGVLSPASQPVAAGFLPHEREHVRILSGELAKLGVTPPPEANAARSLAALGLSGAPRSSPAAVHHLIALETLAERAYYASMARLSDPRLARLAAEIMACEAQHWTTLSGLLHSGDVYSGVPESSVVGG
jgi:hypothetical protein